MKLHMKLVLSLVSGLVIVVVFSQLLQYASLKKIVSEFSEENILLLENREKEFALNMYKSIERAVAGSLERGEMEKFSELLKVQNQVQGLIEFSLFDKDGIVRYSSQDQYLDKKLSDDIDQLIKKDQSMHLIETEESIEIYQPQKIVIDCIRCHTTWENGGIGGVTHFRFSTKALSQANKQAGLAISKMNRSIFLWSVAILLFLTLAMSGSIYFLVRVFVSNPLEIYITLIIKIFLFLLFFDNPKSVRSLVFI